MSKVKHKVFGAVEVHQFRIEGGPTIDLSLCMSPHYDVVSAFLHAPVSPNGTRKVFNFGYWQPIEGLPGSNGLYAWLKEHGATILQAPVSDTIVNAWIDLTGDQKGELMLHNQIDPRVTYDTSDKAKNIRKSILGLRAVLAENYRKECLFSDEYNSENMAERLGGLPNGPDWVSEEADLGDIEDEPDKTADNVVWLK